MKLYKYFPTQKLKDYTKYYVVSEDETRREY